MILPALLLGIAALLTWTINDTGLCVDEPPYFLAGDIYIGWFAELGRSMVRGDPAAAFRSETISRFWQFNHEHPPLAKILYGVTGLIQRTGSSRIATHRLGATLLFLGGLIALWRLMLDRYGVSAAIFSVIALSTMPQVFAHAHMAVLDLPFAVMALLVVVTFIRGLESNGFMMVSGIFFGLALATKINALALPWPLLCWAAVFRRKRLPRIVSAYFIIAPLIFFAVWPWLWHDSMTRIGQYIGFHVKHDLHPTWYWGRVYGDPPAPWHFAPVMLAITTPPITLILALVGIVGAVKSRDEIGALFCFMLVSPMLPLFLPSAPVYDGIRLFMTSAIFLAALAGRGIITVIKMVFRVKSVEKFAITSQRKVLVILGILFLASAPGLVELIAVNPHHLSYFNLLIGGERGALRAGMETTFWGEALNPEVIDYLNRTLPPNATLEIDSESYTTLPEYQQNGLLRSDFTFTSGGQYWILSCQQGYSADWWWQLYYDRHPRYLTLATFRFRGVPLVKIFRRLNDGENRFK